MLKVIFFARAALALIGFAAIVYAFFLLSRIFLAKDHKVVIRQISSETALPQPSTAKETAANTETPKVSPIAKPPADIEPQAPLPNPPAVVKAIYATGWSAGNTKKVNYFIDLIKTTELNAIVIDIKDFSGFVLYSSNLESVKKYNALELRIPRLNSLIKRLHDENIYVIARLSVFQDPRLALARPDLALMSSTTGKLWQDRKGLFWIDPASREAWDYNVAIAKEALSRGFDEINFDYIRFSSDGNLDDIIYPHWDKKTFKQTVIRNFFRYLSDELPEATISADLFGLTTVSLDDLGIGQHWEDALPYFDYIAPMVYPSHYHSGFSGFKNPAQFPYEVVKYSLERAIARIKNFTAISISATSTMIQDSSLKIQTKLRPWLQDFDLGANYNAEMVRKEIQAVYDAASSTPELMNGWMLWNPENIYTREALEE